MGFQRVCAPFGGGQGGKAPLSSSAEDETLNFARRRPEKRSEKVNFLAVAKKEEIPARKGFPNSNEVAV